MPQSTAGQYIPTSSELLRRLEAGTATERVGGKHVPISSQAIYDRFIRPDEERNVAQLLGSLRQQSGAGRALIESANEDAARRLGLGGTGFEAALGQSTNQAFQDRLAAALDEARRKLQEMERDPARMDLLRQAGEAAGRRINRDTAGNAVWSGIDQAVGGALSAAGGPVAPLGAAIQAIGAGRAAHGGAIIGALGSEQAQRFSPSSLDVLNLSGLAGSLSSRAPRGQTSVGATGAGSDVAGAYRRALQQEYGR